jgi:hypothetical protein
VSAKPAQQPISSSAHQEAYDAALVALFWVRSNQMENAIVSMSQFASAPAIIAKKNTAFQEDYGLRPYHDRPKFLACFLDSVGAFSAGFMA